MTNVDYSTEQIRARVMTQARVTAVKQLSPLMRRITFSSPGFVGQEAISCTDTYMKLVVQDPADPEQKVLRSYTVRSHDTAEGLVDIDFALHGKGGFAARWAQSAEIGQEVTFKGIGGGYVPSGTAPWHLLIGDDSALPAIAAAVERLESGVPCVVILEGATQTDLLGADYDLVLSESTQLHVVSGVQEILEVVARSYEQLEGTPHVFLHGEACMVRDVRRVLRTQYAQDLKAMSVSGYWRAGASDEQWREMKRDFAAQQEADEARALAGI